MQLESGSEPRSVETVAQEDQTVLRTAGQRRINLIWEATQGTIAVGMVGTACFGLVRETELPAEYWLLLGIVVNSYFQRTNHTKTGGISGTGDR